MDKNDIVAKWNSKEQAEKAWEPIVEKASKILKLADSRAYWPDAVEIMTVKEIVSVSIRHDGDELLIPIDIFCHEPERSLEYLKMLWAKQKIEREEKYKQETLEKELKLFEELKRKLGK